MRQKIRFAIGLGMLAAVTWEARMHGQTPAPATPLVAPDIPGVVAQGTRVELVREGFAGADDPIAVPGVGLVFSEPDSSRILVLDTRNRVSALVAQSNESHGMTLDSRGRLIAAQSRNGQTKIGVVYPRGREATLADNFEGKPFSRPNDVIVDKKGGVYFTDPGLNGAQAAALEKAAGGKPLAPRLLPAVYYIPPGGTAIKVADAIERPNGVQLSRDEQTLFVTNTNGVYVLAFDIQPDGTVRNRRDFGTLEGRSRFPNGIPGTMTGGDGLTIDGEGRIYALSAAGVEIFSPQGAHLGIIPMSCGGLDCQGLAFGGPGKRTLYVAGHGQLFGIVMLSQGFMGRAK
jgi:gluconolactonase